MFSNLYYLSELINSDLAFSEQEKIQIFMFAEKNPEKVIKLIRVFEDELKGIGYIRKNYKKNLVKIGEKLTNDLLKKKQELEMQHKQKFIDKLKQMKVLESEEKNEKEKELDLLFND